MEKRTLDYTCSGYFTLRFNTITIILDITYSDDFGSGDAYIIPPAFHNQMIDNLKLPICTFR
jgi:hypothetical protein